MLFSLGGQCLVALAFLAADGHLLFGLSLIVLSAAIAGPGQAASDAIVADLVPPEQHETAYAATRIAFNLGVVFGPPIAGLLLLADNWSHFFVGVALLGAVTFVIALRHIPARGAYSPEQPPTRGSFQVIRRDRVFLVFLASTVLAYIVYFGFETALPIAAVDSYGVSPSAWGFLIVMNAGAVAFLQLRLTRRVVRYSPALKLAVALPLMGFSFLVLTQVTSLAALVVVLLLFVLGEMLWVPTSQSVIASLAPEDVRGAYMGAFGATGAFGFALAPFAGLAIRDAAGDTAMWSFFAAVSIVAAIAGAAACGIAFGRKAATEALPEVPSKDAIPAPVPWPEST